MCNIKLTRQEMLDTFGIRNERTPKGAKGTLEGAKAYIIQKMSDKSLQTKGPAIANADSFQKLAEIAAQRRTGRGGTRSLKALAEYLSEHQTRGFEHEAGQRGVTGIRGTRIRQRDLRYFAFNERFPGRDQDVQKTTMENAFGQGGIRNTVWADAKMPERESSEDFQPPTSDPHSFSDPFENDPGQDFDQEPSARGGRHSLPVIHEEVTSYDSSSSPGSSGAARKSGTFKSVNDFPKVYSWGKQSIHFPGDKKPLKLDAELGRGACGCVYRGTDENGKIYAVKTSQLPYPHNAVEEDMALREHNVGSQFDHPGFVKIHETATNGKGRVFYKLDYVDGSDLGRELGRKSANQQKQTFNKFAPQITSSVAHASEKGIFMGDLKPENMLLSKDGRLLQTDFGLNYDSQQSEKPLALSGTPFYICPDVHHFDGKRPDKQQVDKMNTWMTCANLMDLRLGDVNAENFSRVNDHVSSKTMRGVLKGLVKSGELSKEAAESMLKCDEMGRKDTGSSGVLRWIAAKKDLDQTDPINRIITQGLHPDPSKRPTMEEVNRVIMENTRP